MTATIAFETEGAGRYVAYHRHPDGGRSRIATVLGRPGFWVAERGTHSSRGATRDAAVEGLAPPKGLSPPPSPTHHGAYTGSTSTT